MAIHARLVVVGGDVKTSEIKLRLPCTIGRGRGSTIVLAHPLVSRQHCEIFELDGRLMVRDLGSLNGTFVNNRRIAEVSPLPTNELLTIGTVTFRAVYDESSSGAPAAEAAEIKTGPADTVFAGRPASPGSGTLPFPLAGASPTAKTQPASESSREAIPPAAQRPAAKAEEAPAPEAPEKTAGSGEADDDLKDFLKSLGKNQKTT